jgi:7-cyano-7-deazaguanine synthase
MSHDSPKKPAVILLSGGLDSATVLAIARATGFEPFALSFAYGQRHTIELDRARQLAKSYAIGRHEVVTIDLAAFGGSALTDASMEVPKSSSTDDLGDEIPVTYVPARNTVFLSFALAFAETISAKDIFIGVNALDYSGYPDCRPEYIAAFETMANLATKAGVSEGDRMTIHTPLIDLTKAQIIARGLELGVDYSSTLSCYDPVDAQSCGRCDACLLRLRGFEQNGIADPAVYVS